MAKLHNKHYHLSQAQSFANSFQSFSFTRLHFRTAYNVLLCKIAPPWLQQQYFKGKVVFQSIAVNDIQFFNLNSVSCVLPTLKSGLFTSSNILPFGRLCLRQKNKT